MKSGTTLLAQLLDGHSKLFVLPGDSHFMNIHRKQTKQDFTEIVTFVCQRMITPTGKQPFWFFEKKEENFRLFLQNLYVYLNQTDLNIYECIVFAIISVKEQQEQLTKKKSWVEKTPHNELYSNEIFSTFPNAKCIHVLRSPHENIASLKKLYAMRNRSEKVIDHAFTIEKLFKAGQKNVQKYGIERYLLIHYEDLVSSPKKTLEKICAFLGISFENCLLTPSEGGRPATSNSMHKDQRVTGRILDTSRIGKYKTILTKREINTINYILYKVSKANGYPLVCNKANFFCLRHLKKTLLKMLHLKNKITKGQ
jgi:hypothetical protein